MTSVPPTQPPAAPETDVRLTEVERGILTAALICRGDVYAAAERIVAERVRATGDMIDSEGVGTGADEGATGQDTGTAWVTRSADCPKAPAQAHPLGPDGFTRLTGDAAYDRLHGLDGHIQSVTPGRIPPAYHEHDAAGCLDCDCNAAPWSSKTPCTCPAEDAATLAALDKLRAERDEHQWNGLEMARKAAEATARAESAEAAHAALVAERDALRAGIWAIGESIHGDEGVEHVEGCEGEPTCFACILASLRALLAGGAR